MIKYLIFDFDGTLADTNSGIVRTFQATFKEMGLDIPSEDDIKSTIGLTLHDGFKKLIPDSTDEYAEYGVSIYRKHYPGIAFSIIKPFDGVNEVLGQLHSMGYKMVIATSRSHITLEDLADRISITNYFEALYASEDVSHHKPDPEMVNMILKKHHLTPEEAIVIGDATYDLQMGQNAGCKVCGVTWGNQSREMLASVHPDYIIDSIQQLVQIISNYSFPPCYSPSTH